MIVCRFIGWALVLAALVALAYEAMEAASTGGWRVIALGELWYELHAPSLNAAQAGVQRYVAPWLWDPVIATILLWPGWAVLGVPGLLIAWVCRRRSRRASRNYIFK